MGLYQGAMGAWVSLAAGVEADVVEARVLPEDLQEARRVLAMEPAAQGKWFTANRLKLGQCGVGPTR